MFRIHPRLLTVLLLFGWGVAAAATDESAVLQSALNAGGRIPVAAGTHLLAGTLVIEGRDIVLDCEPGATLQAADGYSGPLLRVRNASRVTLRGCTFDGAGQGSNGGVLLEIAGAEAIQVTGNTIRGTVPGMYALILAKVTTGTVDHNRLEAIQGPGISIAEGSSNLEVSDNEVDATASSNGALSGSAIEIKARAGSDADLHDVVVKANTVRVSNGFCFEAGQFGGTGTVSRISIIGGNRCRVASVEGAREHCGATSLAKTCGGFSFAGVSDSEITGNSYDASGQAVDIAGIEMVLCTRCTAKANILTGDTSATASGSTGISLNCTGCTVSGNQVVNVGPVVSNALIDLHTTPSFPRVDNNLITGNTLVLPAGGVGLKGVAVNCNEAAGSLSGTVIAGNTVVGASGAGQGVMLAANADACTLADTQVVANGFSNLATGVLAYRAARVTHLLNRLDAVATPLLDNGGSSFLQR